MRANNHGFRVENKADRAEIYLYDVIGEDFFGGISAKMFADELNKLKGATQIDVRINSPGGDVFAGNTMFNLLKSHPANVTVYVDGLAASIASVIAMAGDRIEMAQNALMMIHDPWGMSGGTAQEHRKLADLLDKVRDGIAEGYASRSGMDVEAVSALMAAETWYTADEAVAANMADAVGGELAIAACYDPKLFKFKNMPQAALVEAKAEPKLTYEQWLRAEIDTELNRNRSVA